jgi:hypothetical protein
MLVSKGYKLSEPGRNAILASSVRVWLPSAFELATEIRIRALLSKRCLQSLLLRLQVCFTESSATL